MCETTKTIERTPKAQRRLLEIVEGCKQIVAGAKKSLQPKGDRVDRRSA